MGGPSAERDISLVTGEQVRRALRSKGYRTTAIDLDAGFIRRLRAARPDVVFIALHGVPGEDGTIQGALELLGFPYVGSGVLASALGMDKARAKMFFVSMGIPAPFHIPVHAHELEKRPIGQLEEQLIGSLGLPMVIKPALEGSAIGVAIVRRREELAGAVERAFERGRQILAEEFIKGSEITVGVLGNEEPQALPVIEIVPENEFYDYEAKYTPGRSRHLIPPRIPKQAERQAQQYAVAAHVGLGCRCFSRVDFVVGAEDHLPYILEINTIPGMTPVSLFPDAARAAGLDFPELVERLIELALE